MTQLERRIAKMQQELDTLKIAQAEKQLDTELKKMDLLSQYDETVNYLNSIKMSKKDELDEIQFATEKVQKEVCIKYAGFEYPVKGHVYGVQASPVKNTVFVSVRTRSGKFLNLDVNRITSCEKVYNK